jgi:AraC-like DNA-binding protein
VSEMFAFDSSAFKSEDEAFARYRELYAYGSDVERTGTPFFARVRSWRLERTLLFERHYGGVRHLRAGRVAEDGFDHFVLNHVVGGQLMGGPLGLPVAVKAGETWLADTCQPMESTAKDVRLITVSVARDAARAAAGNLSSLHGYRIGVQEGGLLSALLRALVEQAPTLPAAAHAAVTRSLVDLLSVAINAAGAGARSEFYRLEHVRRETVRRLIEANLGVADFSVQDIVTATGISRTALYRLFESCGGVNRFIQLCRLQQLRDRLDNRAFDHQSLAEMVPGLGFSNESHASRLFKQAFSVAPGAYRTASIRGAEQPTVEQMNRRWNASLSELR